MDAREIRVLARGLAAFQIGDDGDTDGDDHGWIEWAELQPDGTLRVRADDEEGEPVAASVTLADLLAADHEYGPNSQDVDDYAFAAHAFNLAVARERATT